MRMIEVARFALPLLLSAGSVFAAEPPPAADVWVRVTTEGRDGKGSAIFTKFELYPDGRAVWETDSLAADPSGCGPMAGSFETRVDAAKGRSLGQLARAALKSQPRADEGETRKPRSISRRVFVDVAGDAMEGPVRKETPEWAKLVEAVSDLRAGMDASRGAFFEAKRSGPGRVRAAIRWMGSETVPIQLPKKASEAFSVEGYEVRDYVSVPKEALAPRQLGLSKDKPSLEVELELKPAPGAKPRKKGPLRLSFTNQVVQHHAQGDPLEGARPPALMHLCAPVN